MERKRNRFLVASVKRSDNVSALVNVNVNDFRLRTESPFEGFPFWFRRIQTLKFCVLLLCKKRSNGIFLSGLFDLQLAGRDHAASWASRPWIWHFDHVTAP